MNIKLDGYGDILNPRDVQKVLNIGLNKTYQLLKSNEIKSFKIGKRIKIPKAFLLEYILEQTRGNQNKSIYIHNNKEVYCDDDNINDKK